MFTDQPRWYAFEQIIKLCKQSIRVAFIIHKIFFTTANTSRKVMKAIFVENPRHHVDCGPDATRFIFKTIDLFALLTAIITIIKPNSIFHLFWPKNKRLVWHCLTRIKRPCKSVTKIFVVLRALSLQKHLQF